MKKIIFIISLIVGITNITNAQSSGITFVPGLGETSDIWTGMSNDLRQDDYTFSENLIDYNGNDAISSSASGITIPNNDVVIAHSEGGLLAREYYRQNGSNSFDALITVGTPNNGAPIVNSVLDGTAADVIIDMVRKLLYGPFVMVHNLGFLPGFYKDQLVSAAETMLRNEHNSLQAELITTYQNSAGVNDMKPSSSFMNTLNQNTNTTLPNARYAIYGAEFNHTPWHLVSSAVYSDPGEIENQAGIDTHQRLQSLYLALTAYAMSIADYYNLRKKRAKRNYNFDDYITFLTLERKARQVAGAFNVGYQSLLYGDQRVWSAYVTHSLIPQSYSPLLIPDKWYPEDGILSAKTQAPEYFGALNDRRLRALGANHLEETTHSEVKVKLEQIFEQNDVNITTGNEQDNPLSVTVIGSPQANDGMTLSFSADITNADGPVSYQWYYRQESYSAWQAGGTGSTFQHTFRSAPGGATAHSGIKVEISSAGETASDVQSVNVYGSGGGCGTSTAHSGEITTNNVIPCN